MIGEPFTILTMLILIILATGLCKVLGAINRRGVDDIIVEANN
ncbi:MAG: hypothetical protein QW592_05305 [Candidatus Bathyarchaeia archaeon]